MEIKTDENSYDSIFISFGFSKFLMSIVFLFPQDIHFMTNVQTLRVILYNVMNVIHCKLEFVFLRYDTLPVFHFLHYLGNT